jgi:thioredoxin reductase (NADPH)
MVHRNKVTIIGAGPAGLAAAIYLQRAMLRPQILEKDQPGGLLRNAYWVENYPGFPGGLKGAALADLFVTHAHRLGVSVTRSVVRHVRSQKNCFVIDTSRGRILSSAVIITTGTVPRTLKLSGSEAIAGSRLFYEPTSLPLKQDDRNKRILVIGGGDIAFDYALTLSDWGHDVSIISRSAPTCLALLYSQVQKTRTTIFTECVPEEVIVHPNEILLRCRTKNTQRELSADFILIACGREPNTAVLSPTLKTCYHHISAIPHTSIPGLYLAGDIVRGSHRQAGIAVGDGIHAAMSAERFVKHEVEEL